MPIMATWFHPLGWSHQLDVSRKYRVQYSGAARLLQPWPGPSCAEVEVRTTAQLGHPKYNGTQVFHDVGLCLLCCPGSSGPLFFVVFVWATTNSYPVWGRTVRGMLSSPLLKRKTYAAWLKVMSNSAAAKGRTALGKVETELWLPNPHLHQKYLTFSLLAQWVDFMELRWMVGDGPSSVVSCMGSFRWRLLVLQRPLREDDVHIVDVKWCSHFTFRLWCTFQKMEFSMVL